jgi:hypothetical protein
MATMDFTTKPIALLMVDRRKIYYLYCLFDFHNLSPLLRGSPHISRRRTGTLRMYFGIRGFENVGLSKQDGYDIASLQAQHSICIAGLSLVWDPL